MTEAERRPRVGFLILAFCSGFAVLTIEIAGARLIAPVFGLSAVPWTAVIGVILAALALGSHLGGKWADRGNPALSTILAIAGLSGVLPILLAGFPWAARAALGFIPGAVVSALVLFAPPVVALGAVVPFLVQADTADLTQVGRRAGSLSAAATAGSIAGSFVTGFVLLPAMPITLLLGITAGSLFLMAFFAARMLGTPPRGTETVAGLLVLVGLGGLASGTPTDTLHAQETLYTSVSVTEREWRDGRVVRELWQNGGSSSAEIAETGEPAHDYALVSLELLGERLLDADSVLVLGGAALTLPVAFEAHAPSLGIDVVEIDPAVTELAERFFAYGRSDRPGIRVVHEDGRVFLRAAGPTYDIVYLDVFDHLLTVPWTMVTVEALESMRARLRPGGILAANVLSPLEGAGTEFLARLAATLHSVYPEVRLVRASPELPLNATQNIVVLAAMSPSDLPPVDLPLAHIEPEGRPLTDLWAPVEYLQAKVFTEGLVWN